MARQTTFLLLLLLACPAAGRGGLSAPNSSVAWSRDGSRVLVMLSPDAQYDQTSTATLPDGRVVNLHDTFPKSGAYDAMTLAPLWQVDWFELRGDVLWSDDLRHVVRLNRYGFRAGWAVAFYDGGRLVRTYGCADLLTGLRRDGCLPFSTRDWHTRWYGDFGLDAGRTHVLLSTARRQTYVGGYEIDLGLQEFYSFDLADGSIVSGRSTGAWRAWAYAAAAVACLVLPFVGARLLWTRIARRASRRRRGFPVGAPVEATGQGGG